MKKFKIHPAAEFKDEAKRNFLAAFDARYPAAPAHPTWFAFAVRGFAAAAAIAAISVGGATVYADAANVPAWSPLYPFKRFDENVRLAVAPTGERAALEASFAARRVAELQALAARHSENHMVASLSDDAKAEIGASIKDTEKAGLLGEPLSFVCRQVLSTLVASSAAMESELSDNVAALGLFTQHCEASAAGSISSSTSAAASSPAAKPHKERGSGDQAAGTSGASALKIQIRDFLKRGLRGRSHASSTDYRPQDPRQRMGST